MNINEIENNAHLPIWRDNKITTPPVLYGLKGGCLYIHNEYIPVGYPSKINSTMQIIPMDVKKMTVKQEKATNDCSWQAIQFE